MLFEKKTPRNVVGLDIGSRTVKAVQLGAGDNGPVFQGSSSLKFHSEGILDAHELCQSISQWLDQSGWKQTDICTGLPQYLTTVQIRDFPPTARPRMEKMINYETRHLSGISEENFVNDYHIMGPRFGRKNPVLIGICRESVVDDKISMMNDIGVRVVDLAMDGLAMVNTLFALHPDAVDFGDPQLLLEIGADNSTVVIFAGGQVLNSSSLMLGGQRYTKALAEELGIPEEQAEEKKLDLRLDPAEANSALMETTRSLNSELKNAIDQWRAQEVPEVAGRPFTKIWLGGGGVQLKGLPEYLSNEYQCPAEIFGPPVRTGRNFAPELVTAYGLALQALERENISISLCPADIAWTNQRRKNFRFLAAGIALVLILAMFYLLGFCHDLMVKDMQNSADIERLKRCSQVIPGLENNVRTILHHEKMMLPFVIKGNNVNRFLSAFKEIAKTTEEDSFFVFITDEKSFSHGEQDLKGKTPTHMAGSFFQIVTAGDVQNSRSNEHATKIVVDKISQNNSLILAGFTLCSSKNKHYEKVRRIQEKLNGSFLFGSSAKKVDILSEKEMESHQTVINNWMGKIVNHPYLRPHLRRNRARPFFLRLPYTESPVNIPEEDNNA